MKRLSLHSRLCFKVPTIVFDNLFFSQRPLLFQTSEDIVGNPALGESLPHSVVLHHLFSRAPNELKSPHEVCSPIC